jgi:hypothetical protein
VSLLSVFTTQMSELKMSNSVLTPGNYLPGGLIKKESSFSRYTRMVLQKSSIGHLFKIFRYMTLKSLRSYLTSKGQERVQETIIAFRHLPKTVVIKEKEISGIPKDQHGHAVGIMHPLLEIDVGFQFTNFVLKKEENDNV